MAVMVVNEWWRCLVVLRLRGLLFSVMVACAASGACGEPKGPWAEPAGAAELLVLGSGEVAAGREVFLGYCSFCHEVPAQLAEDSAEERLTVRTVELILGNPPAAMPQIPLSAVQLKQLAAFLDGRSRAAFARPGARP